MYSQPSLPVGEEREESEQVGERGGEHSVLCELHQLATLPPPVRCCGHPPHMRSFLGRCFEVMTCRAGTTCWMLTVWEAGL